MSGVNNPGLVKIRRALVSVSDKTGIVEFARELRKFGVEIVSTGGTARTLRAAGIEVRDVSEVTGFPEMMDGRVKTLHPKIHGALLGLRENDDHVASMREHGIDPIDMVVVNLYPFEETIARKGVTLAEVIEQIDIGGPAMIRSAAKNFYAVTVVVSPGDYQAVIEEMQANAGATSLRLRSDLALVAFQRTCMYDGLIGAYLKQLMRLGFVPGAGRGGIGIGTGGFAFGASKKTTHRRSIEDARRPPGYAEWTLGKTSDLRYGENPHQQAALYKTGARGGIGAAEILSGKEMSFNNYVDADAAWQLVCDFDGLACAIIKHANPAGVAVANNTEEAYRRALACDPVSAFGGIVAFNHKVDEATARALIEIFTEVTIAPDFEEAALEVLRSKKNLRVLRAGELKPTEGLEYKQISGGMLVQTRDTHRLQRAELKVVTKRAPSEKQIDDLLFAWAVCKHTKSNAIVYARNGQTVGIGAGQMSRVDSVKIGAMRAVLTLKDSVLASDAFFPFRDGIDEAAKDGISAVIQPGGSVRDEEVTAAADEHGLAMIFTGVRHFKH